MTRLNNRTVTPIFVSYCHRDVRWLKRLQVHLKPLIRDGLLDLWDDTRIDAGDRWREQIQHAISRARIAVLLISADFLASDFIANNELPPLLKKCSQDGLHIIPLILTKCLFEQRAELSVIQAPFNARPLGSLPKHKQEELLSELANVVLNKLKIPSIRNKKRNKSIGFAQSKLNKNDSRVLARQLMMLISPKRNDKIERRIERLIKPSILVTEATNDHPGNSQIGGLPHVPKGFQWPRNKRATLSLLSTNRFIRSSCS